MIYKLPGWQGLIRVSNPVRVEPGLWVSLPTGLDPRRTPCGRPIAMCGGETFPVTGEAHDLPSHYLSDAAALRRIFWDSSTTGAETPLFPLDRL